MSGSRAFQLLLGLAALLLVVSGCKFDGAYDLPLPGSAVSRGDAIELTADFTDALNVVPRTAVMVDDVVVGQVTQVDRVGWHARVTFLVRKDIKLPRNSEVDVRQTSLLGEKYIALIAPPKGTASSTDLQDGDRIPLARTAKNPEVEEVLGALSLLLSGGGIGQLKTISVEMNKMLNGRQDQARHLLGNLDRMVAGLDNQKDDIIAAMDSIDRLSATLVKEKDTIGKALDAMGPALKVLNRQHQALMTMLTQLDKLGAVGKRVLNQSTDNIIAELRHLQPVLTKLADAGDAMPAGLSMMASFPFPKEAGNIARGDYANALFHMDIDLNKIIKGPGEQLPDPLDLCMGATPDQIGQLCGKLNPTEKKVVCGLDPRIAQKICPYGTSYGKSNDPAPQGNSSGGKGLGGLLGGG
jgi:phospholipid/cholesterol/gamma-HCH transport system substrate-binding protein